MLISCYVIIWVKVFYHVSYCQVKHLVLHIFITEETQGVDEQMTILVDGYRKGGKLQLRLFCLGKFVVISYFIMKSVKFIPVLRMYILEGGKVKSLRL